MDNLVTIAVSEGDFHRLLTCIDVIGQSMQEAIDGVGLDMPQEGIDEYNRLLDLRTFLETIHQSVCEGVPVRDTIE